MHRHDEIMRIDGRSTVSSIVGTMGCAERLIRSGLLHLNFTKEHWLVYMYLHSPSLHSPRQTYRSIRVR